VVPSLLFSRTSERRSQLQFVTAAADVSRRRPIDAQSSDCDRAVSTALHNKEEARNDPGLNA
jgi:hypothetical protein